MSSRHWNQPSEPAVLFAASIGILLIGSVSIRLLSLLGFPFAKVLVELVLVIALYGAFPERGGRKWSLRSVVAMLVLGSALVSGWVFSLSPSHNEQASFDPAGPLSGTDLVHLLVGVGVVAPLYEEKLVRFLMLRGLVSLGPVASTLLVSSLFAIAHEKAMVWSFLASVVFCIAAFRGFTSGQRAVAHGLCNLGILAWHLG